MSVAPFRASTCVVVRQPVRSRPPEFLLVQRTARASFLAGAHVFPGGRVDDADAAADDSWCDALDEACAHWPDLAPGESMAYHVAAIRELFEEAGLLLARDSAGRMVSSADASTWARLGEGRSAVHDGRRDLRSVVREGGLRLALDWLRPIGHWVTPAFESKRFDTRFFVAAAPAGQTARHDAGETSQGTWMTAREALARYERGEIVLFPPTWGTLRDLERFATIEAVLDSTRERDIFRREPLLIEHEGQRLLVLPGDRLCPAPAAEHVTRIHPETRFLFDGHRWVPACLPDES